MPKSQKQAKMEENDTISKSKMRRQIKKKIKKRIFIKDSNGTRASTKPAAPPVPPDSSTTPPTRPSNPQR